MDGLERHHCIAVARELTYAAGVPLRDRYGYAASDDTVLYLVESCFSNPDDEVCAVDFGAANAVGNVEYADGYDTLPDEDFDLRVVRALRPLVESNVKQLILIGEAGPKIGASLEGAATARSCDSMESAIRAGLEVAEAGDVVLLVPACTSFDMYDNFMRRGEDFKRIVGRLAVEHR